MTQTSNPVQTDSHQHLHTTQPEPEKWSDGSAEGSVDRGVYAAAISPSKAGSDLLAVSRAMKHDRPPIVLARWHKAR